MNPDAFHPVPRRCTAGWVGVASHRAEESPAPCPMATARAYSSTSAPMTIGARRGVALTNRCSHMNLTMKVDFKLSSTPEDA